MGQTSISINTEDLVSTEGVDQITESYNSYTIKPYTTKIYPTKIQDYWFNMLSDFSAYALDEEGKIDNTKTIKLNKQLEKIRLDEQVEMLIKRSVINGEAVMWSYISNGVQRLRTAQSLVKIERNYDGELTYLLVMDIYKSGTDVRYLQTEIDENGVKYALVNKDGNEINNTDALVEVKKYLGINEKITIKDVKAEILKFKTNLDNPTFGIPDLYVVSDNIKKLDITFNKIQEEILWRTTSANIQKDNGSSAVSSGSYNRNTPNEDPQMKNSINKISSKLSNGIRVNTFDIENTDNVEMEIIPDRADPTLLATELDREAMRIDSILGIPNSSDTRSFQSSEKEETQNNIMVIETLKLRNKIMKKFLKRVISFITNDEIEIFIPLKDPSLFTQAYKDPIKLLQAGLSRAEIYSIITQTPLNVATQKVIDNNDVMKKDAAWYALYTGSKLPMDKMKGLSFIDTELVKETIAVQRGNPDKTSKEPEKEPSKKGV